MINFGHDVFFSCGVGVGGVTRGGRGGDVGGGGRVDDRWGRETIGGEEHHISVNWRALQIDGRYPIAREREGENWRGGAREWCGPSETEWFAHRGRTHVTGWGLN